MKQAPLFIFAFVLLTTFNLCAPPEGVAIRRASETFLSPTQFNHSAGSDTAMYTISDAGRYIMTRPADPNPANNTVSFIKITASNVTLDLNGHTIEQNTAGGGTHAIGIELANNVHTITIKNGSINGVKGTALKIPSGTHHIHIQDISIYGATKYGIDLASAYDILCEHVEINQCDGSDSTATEGAVGIKLDTCKNVRVRQCSFNNNVAGDATDYATGVYLLTCTDCTFEQCTASNNSGQRAFGFRVTDTCLGCAFNNCTAIANQSTSEQAYGYFIDYSLNNAFSNCIAYSNLSTSSHAYGFFAGGSKVNSFKQCTAHYQDTRASNGNAYGFFAERGEGNMFIDCKAFGNLGGTQPTSTGIGFALQGQEKYSNIQNCHAQSNNGNSGMGYGIFMTEAATFCTIANNRVFTNYGSTNGYGIQDTQSASVSLFIKNISYGNGSSDGTKINNFDVTPAPSTTATFFPSIIAYLNNYSRLESFENGLYNAEIIQQQ